MFGLTFPAKKQGRIHPDAAMDTNTIWSVFGGKPPHQRVSEALDGDENEHPNLLPARISSRVMPRDFILGVEIREKGERQDRELQGDAEGKTKQRNREFGGDSKNREKPVIEPVAVYGDFLKH
jgi:hypothetical protein